MNPLGLLFVAIGAFSIGAAAWDWNWFMTHPKARCMTSILGRTGARIFYLVLGATLVVFGILFAFGIIQGSR